MVCHLKLCLFFTLFFFAQNAQASVDYCQVLNAGGKTEFLEAGNVRWLPLSAPKFLKSGDKIRTADKSYAEISTSSDFSGLLKLGANSELEVMGEDLSRFFLRKGVLFVLREEDSNVPEKQAREEVLFQIFTEDAIIGLLQGGCSAGVSEKGTWVHVYSEHVKIEPLHSGKQKNDFRFLREGFKYFMARSQNKEFQNSGRMHYGDFIEWQLWIKKCYERKDARAKELLVKK